jgi:hypothetical protein
MSGMAVLENVRRYRTIASLCRQTAAFRPAQKWTLLAQAYEWERLAITELEDHFIAPNIASRWETATAARLLDDKPECGGRADQSKAMPVMSF